MSVRIMITGAGSTMGQSVMKALLQSKYEPEIELFITNSEPLGAGYFLSQRIKSRFIVPVAKHADYIPTIKRICKKHKIQGVFSGTEHEIYALSNAAEQLKEQGTIVFLSRPEVIDIGTDKFHTYQYFKAHDIPFAKTALLSDYSGLLEEVGFPLFMKPRTASASRNIFRIDNKDDIQKYQFDDADKIVLQQYLDSNSEYTVEVFCDRNGVIAGTIPMRRTLNYGMSYYGEIDRNTAVTAVSEQIAQALKPEGALNVQLRIVNNTAIPFEINTRFSSTECVRAHYGYNAVEAAVTNYLFHKPVNLHGWRTGMFMRYWHECYFDAKDIPSHG